jgi:glycosyltransferase involved in cell wall biosynthesis
MNTTPRICIDARLYRRNTAGIGRYTRDLFQEFLKLEMPYDVTILLTSADHKEWREDIGDKAPHNWHVKVLDIPHFSMAEQTELLSYLNQEKFDLVHFTNFNHPLRYNGNFMATIYDLNYFYFSPKPAWHPRTIAYKQVMKHAVTKSKLFLTISEYTKQDVVKHFHVNPDKIVTTLLAVEDQFKPEHDKTRFDELRTKYGLTKPFLLFVNSWRLHKGLADLIDAYLRVKKDHDIQLLVAGKPVPHYTQIIDAVKAGQAQTPDIITPGFIPDEDLISFYSMATAYMNTTHFEGFGLGVLEAMSCGCPVITANNTSLPEVVGKAGLYYPTGDASQLADRITQLLNNSQLADELREKGLAQAKKFSFAKTAQETLAAYERALR